MNLFWFAFVYLVVEGYGQSSSEKASRLIDALEEYYTNVDGAPDGLWFAAWWNSANSLEAITQYMLYNNNYEYGNVIRRCFWHAPLIETFSGSYDDAQWWGIAWYRAYELTGNLFYRNRAVAIWNYIVLFGWDNHCGGGVWWSFEKNYKNAITNELFLVLSGLLAQEFPGNSTYKDWMKKEWNWFESSGMINDQYLINDGLTDDCQNNGGITWTYNQGVILGGLHYLYTMTNNNTLLTIAERIADATAASLVYPDHVLREPCEEQSNCNLDQHQFKGIFIRYLGILTTSLSNGSKNKYINWITKNADSIWDKDRNSDDTCGVVWDGPYQSPTAVSQTSAIDVFNALTLLGQ